jgi:uncharacterized protein (TIGR00251 family)
MAPADLPLHAVADGLIVTVKLTPKSRREGIEGVSEEPGRAGPERALKVRVAAVPEDGKANAALLALLAREWDLPRTTLTLAAGATQRLKRIHIKGDPTTLAAKVKARLS